MTRAHIVLTDSGGVQEEAPSLGKPVLVMRDVTERPEAVAAGTLIAAQMSQDLGWIDEASVRRIEELFHRAGLPVTGPVLGVDRYLDLMSHDKKVQDGKLRLVLLRGIGQAVVSDQASAAQIGRAIEARCTR